MTLKPSEDTQNAAEMSQKTHWKKNSRTPKNKPQNAGQKSKPCSVEETKPYANAADSPARRGPKSKLTEQVIEDICSHIAVGGSLRSYCEAPDTVSIGRVIAWLADKSGDRLCTVLQEQYARARDAACEAISGDILDIADTATDSDSASAARVKIDARKWWLSKMRPQQFGDNVGLQIGGNAGITITLERHTTSSADAISHNARSRMIEGDVD